MNNSAQISQWRETLRVQFSLPLIFLILVLPATLALGVAIGILNFIYGVVAVSALVMMIILVLRWDELMVTLIIVVHVVVDWYLALRLVSVLMALILLFVCYFGRSANHPWLKPRPVWLWGLFLTLTIYPAIIGGLLSLYDADTYYPSLVLSAFIMYWLGYIIARNITAVRRVFQLLAVFVVLIAIHTIIDAITNKFLFESARAEAILAENSNYQLVQNGLQAVNTSVSRTGSFFGHPNDNGTFLATSFFLLLGLFIESQRLWVKMLYLLGMLLTLLALMFTYSSGAWIALIVGLLASVIFIGRLRYSAQLIILIVALTVIAFSFFPSQISLQLSHLNAQNESSLHIASWQTATGVIKAFPLSGVGMGNQAYLFGSNPYRVPAQTSPLKEPDNSYLQWGAMAGIPVMLVFLLLLGYVFWRSWCNWQTIDIHYRPLLGGGILALIVLSVNSLSVDGWTNPGGMASLGWLIAGLVASPLIGCCQRQQLVPPERDYPQPD